MRHTRRPPRLVHQIDVRTDRDGSLMGLPTISPRPHRVPRLTRHAVFSTELVVALESTGGEQHTPTGAYRSALPVGLDDRSNDRIVLEDQLDQRGIQSHRRPRIPGCCRE